jgi:peptidoglycan hydrolase-like protein with peptidoglycan-binding domain
MAAGLTVAAHGPAEAATPGRATPTVVRVTPVLKLGSRGPAVRNLQLRLRLAVDGWFGPQTLAAVKRFQKARHLRATGVVDAATWKALPPPPRASRGAPRQALGSAGLNWRALARCESGGNPKAVSPRGFYGLYQFSLSTWRGVGGIGYPHWNSASEQTYRAQVLYERRGAGPWPHCGRLLYS